MNDGSSGELVPSTPAIEELLQERRELMRAIDHWRASTRDEAPDRLAEFEQLLQELDEEMRSLAELFHDVN